jgi:hypothetical protein
MATTFPESQAPRAGGGINFPADHDGKRIGCGISTEALQDNFGDPHGDPMTIFLANRHAVEAKATKLIARGRFEPDGTVFIRTLDF